MGKAVLVVGSVALDSVRTPAGEVPNALGGAATYSSVAAAYFAPVRLVGVVGEDFPDEHIEFLRSRRIDLEGLEVASGKTFRWSGYYDYDLNVAHTLHTDLNVFADFRPKLPESYRDAEYVFLANIHPDLQLDVLRQVRRPKLIAADTMNFWIEGWRDRVIEVLSKVDVAFMNDAEARQLTGTLSTIRAAREVLALGPKTVVIKKGEHGALLFTSQADPADAHFSSPSFPLEDIKDPTGAGDTFAGGFLGFVASQDDVSPRTLRRAVVYGSTLASFNVEDFSLDRMRTLTIDEIQARYRAFQRMAFFEAWDEAAL